MSAPDPSNTTTPPTKAVVISLVSRRENTAKATPPQPVSEAATRLLAKFVDLQRSDPRAATVIERVIDDYLHDRLTR